MPQDTRPTFVWSRLVTEIENAGYFSRRKFSILAVGLIIVTIATIKALLLVPWTESVRSWSSNSRS